MHDETRDIPVSDIVEPRLILRPVDTESVEYLELRDSIAERGILNSICVRPSPHVPGKYEVVDGNYRFHAARDLRMNSLPCVVKYGLTDDDVLSMQIQTNAIRPETTPVEFARQLKRIMALRPGMTLAELSHVVKKRPSWLRDMLGLLDLTEAQQVAVDRSEIPVTSAYMLAKIPHHFREEFEAQARTLPATEFRTVAAAFIKQYMEAVRQGKLEVMFAREFKVVAHVRKLSELEAELKHRNKGALLTTAAGCKTPLDGWYSAIEWVLHLDPESVEEQRRAALDRSRAKLFGDAAV